MHNTMARLSKSQLNKLIRFAKPAAQADHDFVRNLRVQLQDRASQLPRSTQTNQHSWKQRWQVLTSVFAVGAVAVMAVVFIVPKWLNPTSPLNGYIQKGPFISGTTITIQELNDQLQPTGTNYQVTTSSDFGDYRLGNGITSRYVEVIAQGYYFNEVSGELSAAPLTLRAIADVTETKVVNVNVLTTLLAPRLRHIVVSDELSFDLAKQIAEQEVLSIFRVTGNPETDFEQMTISADGTSNGILLAASVLLQGDQSVAELSELLSKLSLAIKTDGVLGTDGPLVNTLEHNAGLLNTDQITRNLKERFAQLDVEASVPDFEPFLRAFVE